MHDNRITTYKERLTNIADIWMYPNVVNYTLCSCYSEDVPAFAIIQTRPEHTVGFKYSNQIKQRRDKDTCFVSGILSVPLVSRPHCRMYCYQPLYYAGRTLKEDQE